MSRRIKKQKSNGIIAVIAIGVAVIISIVLAMVIGAGNKEGNENTQKLVQSGTAETEPLPQDIKVPEYTQPVSDDDTESDTNASAEPDSNSEVPVSEKTDEWNMILANPWNKIPEDFTVELKEIGGGHKVDARIVDDLNEMMSDLSAEGLSAFVCSSYRTNQKQTTLYNNEVNEYLGLGYSQETAEIEAAKWVAIPGTSEHQTGLAIDIMSSYYMVLDEGQEDTAEQQWLMENSYKYGFILRYPNDKSEITGIYYEPWHYRYVGRDVAKEIYDRDICFEEYLMQIK